MNPFILIPLFLFLSVSADQCGSKREAGSLYKGRLEIKGICMNYTIKLLEGKPDTSLIMSHWTDEITRKKHTNVFSLANVCRFPDTVKEGDEFYFKIDSSKHQPCMVCLAYYPKPPKSLSIKVVEK